MNSTAFNARHVVVSGAAGTLGRAICGEFERRGAIVTPLDIDGMTPEHRCDVTDEPSVARALAVASARAPVTDVVHAAGALSVGPVRELDAAEIRRIMDVNLLGAFLVAKQSAAVLPEGGTITLISSQAGVRSGAYWSLYSASKAGCAETCRVIGRRTRPAPHPRQRGVSRVGRHPDDAPVRHGALAADGGIGGVDHRELPDRGSPRTARATGGDRVRLRVPRLGRRVVRQRNRHRGGRRGVVTAATELPSAARIVAVAVPNHAGRLIGKRLPAERWATVLEAGMAMPNFHLVSAVDNFPVLGMEVTGLHTGFRNGVLRPDVSTLAALPWEPGTMIVLCDTFDSAGGLVGEAPRSVLRHQVTRLAERGFEATVASELEFYLFRTSYEEAHRAAYRRVEPSYHRHPDNDILVAGYDEPFLAALRREPRGDGHPGLGHAG